MWIEHGFRALKRMGWEWERTRRTDPTRVARYWLVLAVATLWTLAVGTRLEDAWQPSAGALPHVLSVFQRGHLAVQQQVARGRLWRRLRLGPAPWPEPSPALQVTCHDAPALPGP